MARLCTYMRQLSFFFGVKRANIAHGLMFYLMCPFWISSSTFFLHSPLDSSGSMEGWVTRSGIRSMWCWISFMGGGSSWSSSWNILWNSFNIGFIFLATSIAGETSSLTTKENRCFVYLDSTKNSPRFHIDMNFGFSSLIVFIVDGISFMEILLSSQMNI